VHPAPVKLGSALSPKFFDTYRHLSPGIRAKVRESYRLFVADPASVKFKTIKRLADGNQLCSARVTRDCRVLGVVANREGKMPWSCQAAGLSRGLCQQERAQQPQTEGWLLGRVLDFGNNASLLCTRMSHSMIYSQRCLGNR
jgi:hypothetical protein